MTKLVQLAVLSFAIIVSISGATGQSKDKDKRSLCPQVLAYDTITPRGTRYTANILLRTDVVLRGFRVSIRFDNPVNVVGNGIGPVETADNRVFVIKTRKKLDPGPPFSLPIFVTHTEERVPYIESIKLDGVQICPEDVAVGSLAAIDSERVYQTKPKRALVRPGGSVSLLGRAGAPLSHCEFYHAPNYDKIDFRMGALSPSTRDYEYFGAGLDHGECGITLKNIHDGMDGVIESKIKFVDKPEWENCATTLRVTSVDKDRLPVFEISPRRASLKTGSNLTVACNADRTINMCHIYLPGGVYLNLDEGHRSVVSGEHRYHGTGLRDGNCGVTLVNVDERLNGFVVCKVGLWPDQTNGAWETDSFKVTTVYDDGNRPGISDNSLLDVTSERLPVYDVDPRMSEEVNTRRTPVTPATTERTQTQRAGPVECGKTTATAVPLVTRGQTTFKGQFPWHAAVYTSSGNGDVTYKCGATLIGEKAVVTAAHCVVSQPFDRAVDAATVKVLLGKHHLKEWAENGVQEKRIAQVVVHPNYNKTGFNNDIAVLTFVTAVEFTQFVRPICLWDRKNTDITDLEGTLGTVVGWGIDEDGELKETLTMATMPVVSYQTCVWSKASHFLPLLRQTTYCAGFANGTSVCNGDSGGGMIFPTRLRDNSNKWFLRGVVSNSVPKTQSQITTLVCDPSHYVVFTDAAQYLPWITPFAEL